MTFEKIKGLLIIILYLCINSLFIYKYGSRVEFTNVLVLFVAFIILIGSLFTIYKKIIFSEHVFKLLFYSTIVLFFVFTVILNYLVDGNSLSVDRWSAIAVSSEGVLNGEYPFSIPNHLNQYSSNLPSLIFIGLPFYLLGDVGYLQSFAFLFFAYVIHKTIKTYRLKLFGITLLICSVPYLWEVYTKSDLMSNFIFILGFIVLWNKKYSKALFEKPVLLGGITSFIALTRIPTIIPLGVYLFKSFIKTSGKKRLLFLASAVSVIVILTFIVLKDCPSIEVLKNYNPLILQGNKSPFLVNLISVLLPFYFSFKVKNISETINYSILFISFPVLVHFLSQCFKYGFESTIFNSNADLSYFNMVTPFLIYSIILLLEKKVDIKN